MFFIDHPPYDFHLKLQSGQKTIFDIVRKKYVAATPEEIVRQHIIHYLVHEKKYPKSLLAIEMTLTLNQTQKRCDIVAFNKQAPQMIVECKAPSVQLTEDVFQQIARYNMVLNVPYLLVTNGAINYCCRINKEHATVEFLNEVPDYPR